MQIALAQVNVVVGDIVGNVTRLRRVIEQAKADGARLLVCSEQVLCAYPAEDLVLRADFQRAIDHALRELAAAARGIAVVVGHPERDGEQLYNAASVLLDGQVLRSAISPKATRPACSRWMVCALVCSSVRISGIRNRLPPPKRPAPSLSSARTVRRGIACRRPSARRYWRPGHKRPVCRLST